MLMKKLMTYVGGAVLLVAGVLGAAGLDPLTILLDPNIGELNYWMEKFDPRGALND